MRISDWSSDVCSSDLIRCNDQEAREAARAFHAAAEDAIRGYIAARHPQEAGRVTDFVSTTMLGLSAKARSGHRLDRLLATARLAGLAIAQAQIGRASCRERVCQYV